MADMIPVPKGLLPHGNFNRDLKGDKEPITLAGEQYENLPMSSNIEDRRGDDERVEANTARTVASTRTRMAVKGRQRY
jgi:hypothetical protein